MSKITVKEIDPSSVSRAIEQLQQRYEAEAAAPVSRPSKRGAKPVESLPQGRFSESLTGVVGDEEFDPDILQKLGGPKVRGQGWTLGNSAALVEGSRKESLAVSLAWIVVPSLFGALILAAMFHS